MKVRYSIGPQAGQVTHVERSDAVGLLLALGLLENVAEEPKPAPAKQPDEFQVVNSLSGRGGFMIKIKRAGGLLGESFYDGPAETAPAWIPVEVRQEYALVTGGPKLDPDAVLQAQQNRRNNFEAAARQQNRLTPEEIKAGAKQ